MGSLWGGAWLMAASYSDEIVFTCAPAADSALASGGQSEVQAVIQQFPYTNQEKPHESFLRVKKNITKSKSFLQTSN